MKKTRVLALTCALTMMSNGFAAVSEQEAARLAKDLTPMGATRAGNADGSIPEWTGGVSKAPADYQAGKHRTDPFTADKPLFSINKQNMAKYADKLSAGHKAMLQQYGGFYLNVYPTRRSAAYPQRIYDAVRKNATSAKLTENGFTGGMHGIPFPIPSRGEEVMWNHIVRYRGEGVERFFSQAAPLPNGEYTLVRFNDEFNVQYARPEMTEAALNNVILQFKQTVLSPARLAGGILLVHETLDQKKEPRNAWLYNPGQRRVLRAPNVAFDNPGTASDGMRTTDQYDMFTGSLERYDWKLVGKKEIYVPYNSYKLHSSKLKYKDILQAKHINPEPLRYELHRVWVVEANLKDGMRHVYKRRTFYVDEDSWQILLVDQYDNRDQLWRVSEGFAMNYYDVPLTWTTLEVHTDLQAGRYLAMGLANEEPTPINFKLQRSAADYSPNALRREGVR